MRKILILGTGQAQADIIRALSDRGEYVYACSYISGDAAEKYANEFKQINITDIDAVYDYVKQNHIEYIYSAGSDIAMPTVAAVAKKAGLKSFVSEDTAKICNTKFLLRNILGNDFKGNLRYQELSDINEDIQISFPAMLKPADSQGQRGVYKVNSIEEFRKHFDSSMSFSRMGKVIIEEYADGTEVSVNTFSVDGKVVFSLISDRIVWEDLPGGIIHRHLIPSKYETDPEIVANVNDLVERVLERLDILNGPAYFQIKITTAGEAKLIEVTPRLDGCHMWRLIRYSTGVDLLDMTISLLLDGNYKIADSYSVAPYETEFLCMPPSSVFTRSDFDVSNAEFIHWYYKDGDMVRSMNGYMEKCGYQIIRC